MMNRTLCLIICILAAFVAPQTSQACTAFFLDGGGQRLLGKNFDWYVGDGFVVVNKRHVKKAAIIAAVGDQPMVSWTSKYGSITFNIFGCELPVGGMNEAGLVVTALQLKQTEYPAADSRLAIPQLQWRQYHLDNSSTVKEVIASDSQIRIVTPISRRFPTHYFVCDKSGDCASIEFIGGKLVCHTRETMPAKVLTNSAYAECVELLRKHQGFGGKFPIPYGSRSLIRFVRAASMAKNYDPKMPKSVVDYGFDILANVAQGHITKWRILYDMRKLGVYFHTLGNQQIRYVDLKSFDFSCASPVKVLDINADLSGDVTDSFQNYTRLLHRNWVTNIGDLYRLPKDITDVVSQYPERTVCTQ